MMIMKTAKKSLPATLTAAVAAAPVFPETQSPAVAKLADADLNILASAAPLSPVKVEKPVKAEVCKPVPAAAPIHAAASLLELVQAMDGSKEARYNVALDAVTAAYSVAITYGNKTQLIAVLQSTGRKVCERAMRTAIQTVGALGYHKDAGTRQSVIDAAVATAMTIFADIACKAPVKRAPAVPTEVVEEATGAGTAAAEGVAVAANDTEELPGNAAFKLVVSMAQHGELSNEEKTELATAINPGMPNIADYAATLADADLSALIQSLLDVAAARHVPLLKSA
jgi:hypothetical protein